MKILKLQKAKTLVLIRFAIVYILVFAFTLTFESCNKSENDAPDKLIETEEELTTPVQRGSWQFVARAVERYFENGAETLSVNGTTTKSAISTLIATKGESTPVVRYGFDYVKITEATRFYTDNLKIPFIRNICGDGVIEVYLVDFALYDYEDITEGTTGPAQVGGDLMLLFKGELGMYHCLLNSSSRYDGFYQIVFSSHKYLDDNALEKNFTYPHYEFFVNDDTNVTVGVIVHQEDDGSYGRTPSEWFPLYGRTEISDEKLFNITELIDIQDISLEGKVTGIKEDYFTIETSKEFNLQKVYFDEYTLILEGEEKISPSQISIDDTITVTFDKLYESYNPKHVIADVIIRN
ncbi:MAG: hypothetical protein LBT50_10110 [Prevotellaceae bacterium]|jgi:hypothetical protein|nr:hypothetical protein [Prevotellaceae bacterium]